MCARHYSTLNYVLQPLSHQLLNCSSPSTHDLLHPSPHQAPSNNTPTDSTSSLNTTLTLEVENLMRKRLVCSNSKTLNPLAKQEFHTSTSITLLSFSISWISSGGQWVRAKFRRTILLSRSLNWSCIARFLQSKHMLSSRNATISINMK